VPSARRKYSGDPAHFRLEGKTIKRALLSIAVFGKRNYKLDHRCSLRVRNREYIQIRDGNPSG
jgi:hypothetical protein